MKIHVWGINYSPEITGIGPYNAALCEYLTKQGHEVRMITSFCYYPAWQKLPTEKRRWFRTDRMDEVTVHRCWHYVPKTLTTARRVLHELSFVLVSFLRQLFLPSPRLLVVISPPLLLGAAAWLLSIVKRCPFTFHVQDLQPDAAAGLGMLKPGLFLRVLRLFESFAYRKASLVSGITPDMLREFERKGVPKEKIRYFPNGVELPEFWRPALRGRFRRAHDFQDADFLVVYSGNMGRKQGLNLLLEAAARTEHRAIRYILCGDGAQREELVERARDLNLKNTWFFPLQPEPRYRELLADADLCVIPQQSGGAHCFFPSKLLRILSLSRPVLAITETGSELARAVHEGGFGRSLPPGDPGAIAAQIEQLSNQPELLNEFGRAGFKFVKRFDQSELLAKFTRDLDALVSRPERSEERDCSIQSVPV